MKQIIKTSFAILAVAFVLNLIWENGHAPFYAGYNSFRQFLPLVSIASVWDAIITLGIYAGVSAVKRDMLWIRKMDLSGVLLAIILGLAVAVYIELRALGEGRWGYGSLMPIVPILGVGLLPLLQMMILPLVTFRIVIRIIK